MARVYILAIILVICRYSANAQRQDTSFNSSTRLFNNLYRELSDHYVEPVNRDTLTINAFNGMMRRLDPWTYFMPKTVADKQKAELTKKYGGIGMMIRQIDDDIVITGVVKGFAADLAGIMISDVLVSVNGKSVKGWKTDDVISILRGETGSKVTLVYKRNGNPRNISSTLTREPITVSSVPYYGMLDEHIGYIYLNAMTSNCSQDVRYALLSLKKDPQLRGVILDLRDNGGGYTKEADDIANLFLEKGTMTKKLIGRTINETHYTQYDAVDLKIPLAILIGHYTASSAEILSGILQDYDRAVIIGERSFGKAMVQKVYDLGEGNQVNMTIAHYYTPSGRCIQVKSYRDGSGKIIEDSVQKVFRTKNGRPVKSNNAIAPDISMELRKLPVLALAAWDKHQFYKFASAYRSAHPEIPAPTVFRLTDDEFNEFYQTIVNGNYSYETGADIILKEWKQYAMEEGQWKDAESAYILLKQSIENGKKKELEAGKPTVKSWLEREICRFYYDQAGWIEASIKDDPIVLKAKEVLRDRNMYNSILGVR